MRRVLQQCRKRPVELIYFFGPESGLTPITSKSLLAKAAEELCLHYANTGKVQVKVFRCPYLYSTEAAGEKALGAIFRQLSEGTVRFDEQAQQPVFALCFEELASLVNRVFDIWMPEPELLTLPEAFHTTCQMLGDTLQQLCPGVKAEYGTDTLQTYPADDKIVRQRYGWFQRYDLPEDLPCRFVNDVLHRGHRRQIPVFSKILVRREPT